jgi:NitT/TauT family transport system permease protein
MIPSWLTSIRGIVPKKAAVPLGLVPIALLVALWFLLTSGTVEERVIGPTILPSPSEVVESVPKLFHADPSLWIHIEVSLRRVLLGYLLALAIVLPLGITMGAFGIARSTFTPVTTASGYIPIATLLPLTMAWFGTGEQMKIVFLAMAFAIYLLPMIIQSIDAVPDVYLRTSYTLGAGRAAALLRVLIPIALPDIWHGMRLAFGVGWTYLVLAEVVVQEKGLGSLVAIAQRRGPREHVYLVILVITIIAWIADLAWVQLGHLLFPYKRSQQ